MDKKNKQKETSTDFKGAVSLDAIFAAKDKQQQGLETESISVYIPEPEKKKEEVEELEEETKQEIDKPVEDKQKPEEKVTKTESETEAYRKMLYLIEAGYVEDFKIQVSEDDEEGTLISEFKTMTEDNFKELVDISKKDQQENIKSNYISKDGLKEHELKVIEILKNGGDFSLLADKEEDAFKRPFEGFDMDVRERQIDVLYTDFVVGKGLDKESAISLIKTKETKGTLEKDAKEVFKAYRDAHSNHVDSILKKQAQDKEFKELNFKENKKVLTAKLKEIGLKESSYRKVVSEYSKRDEKGNFELVQKVVDILNNPEENYELILHLADKDLFGKSIKLKTAQETQKAFVKLTSNSNNKGNRKSVKPVHSQDDTPIWLRNAENFNNNLK